MPTSAASYAPATSSPRSTHLSWSSRCEQAQQQLAQTRAALGLAKADLARWKSLAADSAVSREELDQKTAAYDAAVANSGAAEANVKRLTETQRFTKVDRAVQRRDHGAQRRYRLADLAEWRDERVDHGGRRAVVCGRGQPCSASRRPIPCACTSRFRRPTRWR